MEAPEKILRDARNSKRLKQEEVASQAGISARAYQLYEEGKFPKYKSATIQKIDGVLGTNLYEILYERKYETVNEDLAPYETLRHKNETLEESVRSLTATIQKHADADLIRAENERKREDNIERLIELLKMQVASYGTQETAPVPPVAPGTNAEDASKPENLLGNKKKSGRQ